MMLDNMTVIKYAKLYCADKMASILNRAQVQTANVRRELERYLESLAEFHQNTRNNRWLVIHFGYFLTEIRGEFVSPQSLRRCYETVSLSAPRNISDVISKSKAFVRTTEGLRLHRDTLLEISAKLADARDLIDVTEQASAIKPPPQDKVQNVVVVHGRDEAVRMSMFQFLRALRLNPIEWSEAVRATGHGAPYVGQVLDSLFDLAQAVIVLFTPDENAQMKDALKNDEDDETVPQPRPNVLIECGMALARDEVRTIIVQVGTMRAISDLSGRQIIRLNNSAQKRIELAQRLETAGCAPSTAGTDWLNVGNFAAS
jgi:predicted nucleotide-binding protein